MSHTNHIMPLIPALQVQELVNRIVDHVANDQLQPLLVCASISRSFNTQTTKRIFSTIHIKEVIIRRSVCKKVIYNSDYIGARLRGLVTIMDANPAIGPLVRSFIIEKHAVYSIYESNGLPANKQPEILYKSLALARILPKLTRIRKLGLKCTQGAIDFADFRPAVYRAFENLFRTPSLESLELCQVNSFPLHFFALCAANLKSVHLTHMSYSPGRKRSRSGKGSSTCTQVDMLPLRLEHAYFNNADYIARAFVEGDPCASAPPSPPWRVFSQIKSMRLGFMMEGNEQSVVLTRKVIEAGAETLESLELINFGGLGTPGPFDLGVLDNFKDLTLSSFCHISSYAGQVQIFSTPFCRCPPGLETFTLDLKFEDVAEEYSQHIFRPEKGWAELERCLTSSQGYQSLKKLTVNLWVRSLSDDWNGMRKRARESFKKLFPAIRASSRVDVNMKYMIY